VHFGCHIFYGNYNSAVSKAIDELDSNRWFSQAINELDIQHGFPRPSWNLTSTNIFTGYQ
jgi:hypothetical protein